MGDGGFCGHRDAWPFGPFNAPLVASRKRMRRHKNMGTQKNSSNKR